MLVAPILSLALYAVPAIATLYAPISTNCPATSLVRAATGLSDHEERYRVARKAVADEALRTWLKKTHRGFCTEDLPTIALTTSGGGYRSLLSGAGVVQGLDARDSDVSTSGLYQALTYHAGLSGGGWLLSSISGNNWPTVTYLKENLWQTAFRDSLLDPSFLLVFASYAEIVSDVLSKDEAGFDTTLTDVWGRLLSYQLLTGSDGGVATTMSSLTSMLNFTKHAVPFPIITSLGTKVWEGQCIPGPNATTYEFSPYEFGSWDKDVSAFTPTKYLGTAMKGGKASTSTCTTNFDNLGLILGTSSNLFNEACASIPADNSSTNIEEDISALLNQVHTVTASDLYGRYPNPFYDYISSTSISNSANNISAQETLSLVDGGEALQNNPIFPLLQPDRNVSVILVNDNSADSSTNFPNGTEILTTYIQALNNAHLSRMPYIPPVATFIAQNLTTRATFFGCGNESVVTIVYLPNTAYSFASGVSTYQLEYSEVETDEMIANGVQIATQGGSETWGTCLGCAIMMKTGRELPEDCEECFEEYCYYE